VANEITVTASLIVRNEAGSVQYQSMPMQWTADLSPIKGPAPGYVAVSLDGVDIDLSALGEPGVAWIQNVGSYDVTVGVWDVGDSRFQPFARLEPGQFMVVPLSPDLGEEFAGTGTGTTAALNRLRAKAHTAASALVVHAFNRY
jgi:hypothetical protein